MSAHAALRHFVCSLAFTPFVLAIGGCSGSPVESGALARNAAMDVPPSPETVEPEAIESNSATDLAGLAQRDVNDFMLLREGTVGAKPQASAGDESANQPGVEFAAPADAPEPTVPPEIIWTDPVGQTMAIAAADATAAIAEDASVTMGEATPDDALPNGVLANHQAPLEATSSEERLTELLVGLSSELYMRASDADQPLRELIMISATSMVDPSRKLANIEALPGLTEREREMLAAFQSFLLELGSKLDGSEEADAAIVTALQQLQTSLVKPPTLTIPSASLCTSVDGYGKYQPFSENRFLAHAGQQLVVYVEIDDFACTQGQTGQWVTELAQQLVIYSDSDGIPVWREEWLPVVDTSTKPRQDFYTTQLVTLPDALSVGKYQLKIRLRDEQSGAEAEQAIEFEMVADPKLAAKR